MLEFLKKTWKFFLGVGVAVLSVLLIFRKDNSGEIIEESTKSGVGALDSVIKSNDKAKKKLTSVEIEHEKKVEKIRQTFDAHRKEINPILRGKIERALDNSDIRRATMWLSGITSIKNLDSDS